PHAREPTRLRANEPESPTLARGQDPVRLYLYTDVVQPERVGLGRALRGGAGRDLAPGSPARRSRARSRRISRKRAGRIGTGVRLCRGGTLTNAVSGPPDHPVRRGRP